MLKKEIEEKLKRYEELLNEIGRWVNPLQYDFEDVNKYKLLFHINGIRKILDEKFYIL